MKIFVRDRGRGRALLVALRLETRRTGSDFMRRMCTSWSRCCSD